MGAMVRTLSTERKHVMIVDDNMHAADSLARLLEAMGHEASVCYSGPATLARVRDTWPDLMIVDIGMPDMDGYELVQKLQPLNTRHIPIIALTGYGFVHDKERALHVGFIRHVTKPIGLRELTDVLTLTPPPHETAVVDKPT